MPDDPSPADPGGGESEADIIADLVSQHADQAEKAIADKPLERSSERERDESEHAQDEERGKERKDSKEAPKQPARKKEGDDEPVGHDDVDKLSAKQFQAKIQKLVESDKLEEAFLLAFGKKPEAFDVNSGKVVAIRQHEQRERQKTRAGQSALLAQQTEFNEKVRGAVERLTPYEKYYEAEQAFRRTNDTAIVRRLVTELMGAQSYSEANKRLLHDDKSSPAEMRMAAQLQALQQQLAEREQQTQRQQQERTVQEQRGADLAHIRKSLQGHEAAKLPRFEERVYRVLEKHFDPRLGLQITLEDAAERVVRGEKRRLERSPFYKPPQSEPESKAAPRGSGPPLRRDSQNNGAKTGDESLEDIIGDLQQQIARQKQAERKKSA